MIIFFRQTSQFEERRIQIEQHLFDSVLEIEKDLELALRSVKQFSKAIDRFLDTFETMYQSPKPKDTVGEKSFPISDGHYRVFFKISIE